jgi:hypothetical protein
LIVLGVSLFRSLNTESIAGAAAAVFAFKARRSAIDLGGGADILIDSFFLL